MNGKGIVWRNVAVYCVLAFALLWIPFFGAKLTGEDGNASTAWRRILGVMGPYSPLVAAVLMRTVVTREGFRDAHLGVRASRRHFWLIALLLPFLWNGVQDASQLLFGFAEMNWAKMSSGLYRVPINLLGGLAIFIGEEFGWRSYLLEKLRPLGRWKAFLLSGSIWSLWHVPLVIVPSSIYARQLDLPGAALALLVFVLMGFIFGWLYVESNSVWPCVLMHSFNNLISLKLFREAWTATTEPTLLQNTFMAVVPIAVVWLVLYWKRGFARENVRVMAETPGA